MKNLNSASTSVEDKYKLIYRELQNILQAGLNNESVFDVDCFMIRSNNVSMVALGPNDSQYQNNN